MKSYVDRKCEDNIYIFKEEINNYIDIARSTQVGESSLARNDYQVLSKQVLMRILEMEKKDRAGILFLLNNKGGCHVYNKNSNHGAKNGY